MKSQELHPLRLFVPIFLFIISWNAGLWAALENTSMVSAWHFLLTNGIFVWVSAAPITVEGPCLDKEGARVKWLSYVEQTLQEEENFPSFIFDKLIRIWSRNKRICFMKTKPELYKDRAENHNPKTGKILFCFMCWSLVVYIICCFASLQFQISDNFEF